MTDTCTDGPIPLADGSTTHDRRLDRVFEDDLRNKEYLATGILSSAQRTRTHTWDLPHRFDQGQEGACVGFCWAHELTATPAAWDLSEQMRDPQFQRGSERFARAVYYDAQRRDQWPGEEPEMQGTSVLAAAKVLRDLGYIESYRWAYNVEDLALAVAFLGPAVLGSLWLSGMENTDRDGYLNVTGRITGGHCTLVIGVDVEDESFQLVNSWGTRWGDGGGFRLRFDDMATLLKRSGEACIPIGRATQKKANQ